MTIASSGQIRLNADIQAEFGGSNPTSLSEYYRGGAYVPNHPNNTSIPTSGAIKLSNFYATSYRYYVTVTISSNVDQFTLTSALSPSSYSVPYTVTVVINGGVICYSSSTSSPAFNIGTGWYSGTVINLYNYGYIVGKGGAGGGGGTAQQSIWWAYQGGNGSSGGPGLQIPNPASTTVNLYNYGTIGGGGGGGAGGGGGVNSGAYAIYGAGGGGGGGAGYGDGGAGGTSGSASGISYASAGSAGGLTSGGAGGSGLSSGGTGGPGGSGGNLGQNGSEAYSGCGNLAIGSSGYYGAGGYSIVGYPWINVYASGTISGSTTSYPASLPSIIANSNYYNHGGCPYALADIPYANGGNNPYYVGSGDGDGGADGGSDD